MKLEACRPSSCYPARTHTKTWALLSDFRCRIASLVLILFIAPHIAKAQFSIYGTLGVAGYGYSQAGSNDVIFGRDHIGFGAGATYNFPIQSRLTAGIDLRGAVAPSDYGGSMGTASLRFGFVPHHNRLKPYLQIGGGFVTAKTPSYVAYGIPSSDTVQKQSFTNGALALALGLDVRILPSFDWRLLEIQSAAGGNTSNNTGMAAVSTGIVYCFPRR